MTIPPNERLRRLPSPLLTETLTPDQQDELSEIDWLLLNKIEGWETLDPDLRQVAFDELHEQERMLLANSEVNEIVQAIAKQLGSVYALALVRTVIQEQPETFRRLALLQQLQQTIENYLRDKIPMPNLARLSPDATSLDLKQQILERTILFLETGEVNFSVLQVFVHEANKQIMVHSLSSS